MDKTIHILVCLSSAPSNARIVREAGRMASAYHSEFTALFVETPAYRSWHKDDRERLQENIRLAETLGARIETVSGEDVAFQISEYARHAGVTTLVIGQSAAVRHGLFFRQPLTERLITLLPGLDIHIIPDISVKENYTGHGNGWGQIAGFSIRDILICLFTITFTTMLGLMISRLGMPEENLITIYILGVLIISAVSEYQIYSLISSVVSVVVFNFFFTEPRYTLLAHGQGYPLTFVVMFLAALLTGTLANRLKVQARMSAESAYRTRLLLDLSQLLQNAKDPGEILTLAAEQIRKLLKKEILLYPDGMYRTEQDGCLYFEIQGQEKSYGWIGIRTRKSSLSVFERDLLTSMLNESGMALDSAYNRVEKEQATMLAQKEQLRANLLRSISHDLRTPLTSISGNAWNLFLDEEHYEASTRHKMYEDIHDDAQWLISLVENLLSISRLEEGKIHASVELLEDVITEALQHVDRNAKEYQITVEQEDEFLMARMDGRLIVQVLINLINNAIKYTEKGSGIRISSRRNGRFAEISVSDDGDGIAEDQKEKIFEMFYSSNDAITDSRRSMGLGLALCKSIVTAHGGTIYVENRAPHGAQFVFTLPAEEVTIHE